MKNKVKSTKKPTVLASNTSFYILFAVYIGDFDLRSYEFDRKAVGAVVSDIGQEVYKMFIF